MQESLIGIKNELFSMLQDVEDHASLEALRLQYLGRSGKLTLALKEIPKLPIDERPVMGRFANQIKAAIEDAIKNQELRIKNREKETRKYQFDFTNPGIKPPLGHLHVI